MDVEVLNDTVMRATDIWGPEKTIQLIILGAVGACIFLMVGMNVIPNNPKQIIEKENN